MENQKTLVDDELAIGEQVVLKETTFSNKTRDVMVKVVDVRWILGKLSYVIETEDGKRKVVGPTQVSRAAMK